MLDTTTKRRIDTARDILVGKIPDPKSQVEQITIALIYKFMDDMDAEAEELGGSRKFFADGFSKYGWARLMHTGLGGHEMLNLYADAISRMPENPGIPPLFRNIFKNAYLPYRDPETLRSFLKIIDEFSYDHSERLGDAFEYLLSVLGSQGDAGQFRTPRHIIDFIVEIVAPQKNETVLDPACGTAGFLISSYKHILKNNLDEKGYSTLTPDEKGRMVENFKGYDISPDMVRLSLVNLYLHGFSDPHIYEYDTLTSQERWNEYADVILANPPFMSPKGGIRPHNRFSVQSKRSEVLFVDYIADHLTPDGRAGVIVPEGIIFQSQNAYKQLRKKLIDESLVAVVSLPAGVFQPYSGVKTSILILDKALAKKADTIAFFKVENDGFGLGAQRRPIDKNDLPQVLEEVKGYLDYIRAGDSSEEYLTQKGLVVKREKVAENGEYNLSGERYREKFESQPFFPYMEIKDLAIFFKDGDWIESKDQSESGVRLIQTGNIGKGIFINKQDKSRYISEDTFNKLKCTEVFEGDILVSRLPDPVGRSCMVPKLNERSITAVDCTIVRFDRGLFLNRLFPYYSQSDSYYKRINSFLTGSSRSRISRSNLGAIQVPVPPIETQREIVAEIESYQKVIDGARAVVENYRPHIPIDPDWPKVELGKVAKLINGRAYKQHELLSEGPTPVLRVGNFFSNKNWYYSDLTLGEDKYCDKGDLLYAWSASFGPRIWEGPKVIYHYHIWKIITSEDIDKYFLYYLLLNDSDKIKSEGSGIAMMHATKGGMEKRKFPLPQMSTQKAIVAEIEAEQAIVNSNCDLIERFTNKIENTISRIWGELP